MACHLLNINSLRVATYKQVNSLIQINKFKLLVGCYPPYMELYLIYLYGGIIIRKQKKSSYFQKNVPILVNNNKSKATK